MFDEKQIRKDVEERNQLRKESGLAPISVKAELKRLRDVDASAKEANFIRSSPLRPRVEAKVLAIMRRQRNDPNWIPTGFTSGGGYWYHLKVQKVMSWLYGRQT